MRRPMFTLARFWLGAIRQRSILLPKTWKPRLVPIQVMSEAKVLQSAKVMNAGTPNASKLVSTILSTMEMKPIVPAHQHWHTGMLKARTTSIMAAMRSEWSQKKLSENQFAEYSLLSAKIMCALAFAIGSTSEPAGSGKRNCLDIFH